MDCKENKKIKIGLFDSGIGGFSILRDLLSSRPFTKAESTKRLEQVGFEFYYFSDSLHAPYGNKSNEEIFNRSCTIVEQFDKIKVDLIVVACNTATAACIDRLRGLFPEQKIVGVEPYLNAIHRLEADHRLWAVITTITTGESTRFVELKKRLDPDNQIALYKLPNLAFAIEQFAHNKIDDRELYEICKSDLSPLFKSRVTHLILGCTHYPLIENAISILTKATCLSPGPSVKNRVLQLCDLNEIENKGLEKVNEDEIIHEVYLHNSLFHREGEFVRYDPAIIFKRFEIFNQNVLALIKS